MTSKTDLLIFLFPTNQGSTLSLTIDLFSLVNVKTVSKMTSHPSLLAVHQEKKNPDFYHSDVSVYKHLTLLGCFFFQAMSDMIENKSRQLEHDSKNLDFGQEEEEESIKVHFIFATSFKTWKYRMDPSFTVDRIHRKP